MAYLHEQQYTPLTVPRFVQLRTQGQLPARPVLITFDDGFADFFTAALPVLQRYKFTATLYVATAFINGTSRWLVHKGEDTTPMLTWEQLAEVSKSGIECGGHSHHHRQLDILPRLTAQDEIVRCKNVLEDGLGVHITSFAYPHGYHTANIQQMVRNSGYTSACAVNYTMSSINDDTFALSRLLVGPTTDAVALEALLAGRFTSPSLIPAKYKRPLVPAWRLVRYCKATIQGT